MNAERDKFDWIEDFSILLTRQGIRNFSRDPDLELFAGSKLLASLWLASVAGMAGALGGLSVSGALWASLFYPIVWLLVVAVAASVIWLATRWVAGAAVAFLAGWCIFWGLLTGIVAGWSTQLDSAGWAYGIAGGFGFLIGITHGNLQHVDVKGHESWFMTGTILGPASLCLVTILSRAGLIAFGDWEQAACVGLIAALLFLGPVMALYMARWQNKRALLRLSSLYLHNDEFIAEAITLLDRAIRSTPEDEVLLARRALAHALKGDEASAEADWARLQKLNDAGRAADLAQGWVHLRSNRLDAAADAFDRARGRKPTRHWGIVGRSLVHLRKGEPAPAIDLLRALPIADIGARDRTYLAQAHLALRNFAEAVSVADVAIDELDSIHGLSLLVRAEAQIALGHRDHAIADLNRALSADDEAGIEQRTLALLESIDGAVLHEEELDALENSLAAR